MERIFAGPPTREGIRVFVPAGLQCHRRATGLADQRGNLPVEFPATIGGTL